MNLTRRQSILTALGAFLGLKAKARVPPVIEPVYHSIQALNKRWAESLATSNGVPTVILYRLESPGVVATLTTTRPQEATTLPVGETVWGAGDLGSYAVFNAAGKAWKRQDCQWVEVPVTVKRATDCGGREM